jgi:hypothetical protein
MDSYDKRAQDFGFASKELIQAIISSHIESGTSNKYLFLDVRNDAERAESQLQTSIPVAHIIVTPTDTSALEESTLNAYFPNKQGKE